MRRRDLIALVVLEIVAIVGAYWFAFAVSPVQGGTFAGVATAIGTIVLAALTAVLLQLNSQTVGEMRNATAATLRAAVATEVAAQATDREARATEASNRTLREQIEREWRPLLVLMRVGSLQAADEFGIREFEVDLVNLGRGPAVNALICLWNEPAEEVWRSQLVHVPAGKTVEVKLTKSEEKRNDMFDRDPPRSHQAIMCEDQSGSWHRFSRNDPVPDSYYGRGSQLVEWAAFYSVALNRLP